MTAESPRKGDAIAIDGAYQHRALTEGPRVQRFWHESKLKLLEWFWTPPADAKVLEVGAGSGVFADAMARAGARVTGVDANAEAVRYATEAFARDGLSFRHGYLDELELPEASFDAASCLEVIEHVYPDQVKKLLADLRRVLRPGGTLLLTTPNYRGVWPVIEWAADRFASTANMDADQHVTRFHRRMLRGFLEEAGFEVKKIRTYCTFAPFAAGLWWRGGRGLERVERKVDLPFGSLLVALAERDSRP